MPFSCPVTSLFLPSFPLTLEHTDEREDDITVGSVIRTDGMTMREWAAQQVANRESTRKVPVYLTSRLESSQRLAKEWSAAHQNTKD